MLNSTVTFMRVNKMKEWGIEKAQKLFTHELVGGEMINFDDVGFSREFSFIIDGIYYEVYWVRNLSTLKIGENGQCHLMFLYAEISSTWPSHPGSDLKLQFRDENNNCIAAIPLTWRDK